MGNAELEQRVLAAVKTCCARWGIERTTVDDIARESGMSRATLYRLFPGGREVLFDAHRRQELDEFFQRLLAHVEHADDLAELVAKVVSLATRELRADEHVALMLASQPGSIAAELTIAGLPQTINVATRSLAPLLDPFVDREQGRVLIDVLVRLVLSYFLAPSDLVDLADEDQARTFVTPFLDALPRHPVSTGATR